MKEDINFNYGPPDAEAWGPETAKYMQGWYKISGMGKWCFAQSKNSGWGVIDRPTTYRQRQLVRRPK